jgi:phosphoserine phosphatase RsbX
MPDKMTDWSVAIQVREGESICGDHYLICRVLDRVLVAAIDGVGHGPEAALASRKAAEILEANADQSLAFLFTACHNELHGTRGVVMSLAVFDWADSSMAWLGVGNVQGRLLRADKTAVVPEEELLQYSGVLGHSIPALLVSRVLPVAKGDVLILATDGIQSEFTKGLHIGRSAQQITNDILNRDSRGTDDALVLVAKYRGEKPVPG